MSAWRLWKWAGMLAICCLCGCATRMVTSPAYEDVGKVELRIPAKLGTDCNREYVPRIVDEQSEDTPLVFKYRYEVTYGRDNTSQLLPLFNPLTILGFPIGEDTMIVLGTLEIFDSGVPIKKYTAVSAFEKTRNLFSEGETMTMLRRKGLLSVRNNLEEQVYQDRGELQARLSRQ